MGHWMEVRNGHEHAQICAFKRVLAISITY